MIQSIFKIALEFLIWRRPRSPSQIPSVRMFLPILPKHLLTLLTAKSLHSRAARRAVSPSLDVDKSITSLPRPETTISVGTSALGSQHNSGVSKKKKSKQKSRAQKLRQEKGLQRAEIVMDKTEKKVSNSVQRGKRVKARKVG